MRGALTIAAVLLSAPGCHVVFGNDPPVDAAPDAAPDGPVDGPVPVTCAPMLADDPLRYTAIRNPNTRMVGDIEVLGPWTWMEARHACQLRGMDLAVFNDVRESGRADVPGWPYWIGESIANQEWKTIDGCPSIHDKTVPSLAMGCGMVDGPLHADAARCDGALALADAPVMPYALCETPRSTDPACVTNDPSTTRYVASKTPLAHDAARSFCAGQGGRMIAIDSYAELRHLSQLIAPEIVERAWIGSQFDGAIWRTENSCPATYSWFGGAPELPMRGTCLATSMRREVQEGELEEVAVFEGFVVSGCDEAFIALCEIGE